MTSKPSRRSLGYLSAAPRVSTRPEAELGGPRSHVLGTIHAFEALGWRVKPFIVGDRTPQSWVATDSGKRLRSSRIRVLLADLVRVAMGLINRRRAWRELGGQVEWVYERYAAFQALGRIFQKRGAFWILETNAPFFIESTQDRQTLVLSSLARFLEVRAYHDCDRLVCVSEALKQIMIEQAGVAAEKIIVVPNGVDTAFFDPTRYRGERLLPMFTIGFVGAMLAWQGLRALVETVGQLHREGLDLGIVLVGDGPARPELEETAQSLGMGSCIRFVGRVSRQEIPPLIKGFDLGFSGQIPLQAGKMYLSPLKLYEYMAMGKPVIASDFEDARRAIRDRQTGFLFAAGDQQQLKKALLDAYEHRESLPAMGRQAREDVLRDHSWVSRVSDLLAAIEPDEPHV